MLRNKLYKFTDHLNHTVRFADHEWSGIWTDITTTLMHETKSSEGLKRRRFRHESAHKCPFIRALSNELASMEYLSTQMSHEPRLRLTRKLLTLLLMVGLLEEVNLFDTKHDKRTLVSFSTGYSSTTEDQINADQAEKFDRDIQAKMNRQMVLDSMEVRQRIKSLESLRSAPKVNEIKRVIDSLKLLYCLIIISDGEVKTKETLPLKFTLSMSLFDKVQKL